MALAKVIAQNAKALRLRAGLSQHQLAKRTGLSVRYISRLENTAPNVTLDVIERLSKGLECSPVDLVGGSKAEPASKRQIEAIDQAIRALQSLRSRFNES